MSTAPLLSSASRLEAFGMILKITLSTFGFWP